MPALRPARDSPASSRALRPSPGHAEHVIPEPEKDLDGLLQRLESVWREQGAPIADHLAPGLTIGVGPWEFLSCEEALDERAAMLKVGAREQYPPDDRDWDGY